MHHTPKITCSCCRGTGKIDLPADMWRTLQRLHPINPKTTEELLEKGISRQAICNRLRFLESHKLIDRIGKNSKFLLWVRLPLSGEAVS